MPTANEVIAHSLTASKQMLLTFVGDLTPQEFLHRPAPKVNCAAWIVGHLALTDRRILGTAFEVTDGLPELPAGFERQFSREEGCPQAESFGDVAVLVPLFTRHRDLLIEAVKSAPAATLDRPLPRPHPLFRTAGEAVSFMTLHTAMHAGQITVIRRSLGRPPII